MLLYEQARQLESLIRMAEARARLELVQIVTAQHAQVGMSLHVSHAFQHASKDSCHTGWVTNLNLLAARDTRQAQS